MGEIPHADPYAKLPGDWAALMFPRAGKGGDWLLEGTEEALELVLRTGDCRLKCFCFCRAKCATAQSTLIVHRPFRLYVSVGAELSRLWMLVQSG